MVQVKRPTVKELRARRAEVLARLDLSEEDLRRRAGTRALTEPEWEALEELSNIDFLLGDDA